MNTSAKLTMSILVFAAILIFYNNQRIMTALVAGLVLFTVTMWKGSD